MIQFIKSLNLDRVFMCIGFGLAGLAAYVVWTEKAPLITASALTQVNAAHSETLKVYDMGKSENGTALKLECKLTPDGTVKNGKVKYVNSTSEVRDAIVTDKDYAKLVEICEKFEG